MNPDLKLAAGESHDVMATSVGGDTPSAVSSLPETAEPLYGARRMSAALRRLADGLRRTIGEARV